MRAAHLCGRRFYRSTRVVDARGPRGPGETEQKDEDTMRLGSVILVIWLIIGLIATAQRGYFNDRVSCASAGTVIVTILAGPLNYIGVNPKLSCH
jgi:hypothetical protein